MLTPLLVLLLLVVVALGRMASARLRVDDAAHQVARAASLARTPAQARRQAAAIVHMALAAEGASCARVTVTTHVGAFTPGGLVRVTIACAADLGITGLPGQVTVTGSASSVIDPYRAVNA